jgi:hypothetical protein
LPHPLFQELFIASRTLAFLAFFGIFGVFWLFFQDEKKSMVVGGMPK